MRTYVSGKQESETIGSTKPRPIAKKDWIIIPDKHPAIVSKEIFEKVQNSLFKANNNSRPRKKRDYLLRGKIKCGCCNHALLHDYSGRSQVLKFRCHYTRGDKSAECNGFSVSVEEVDEAVMLLIKNQAEIVLNSGDFYELHRKSDSEKKVVDYENLILQCAEERQKLYERFVLREIGRDEYLKLKNECNSRLENLNAQFSTASPLTNIELTLMH